MLGIDLGTSSVKAMLLDSEKGVLAVSAENYSVEIPCSGYAQQRPEMWWEALCKVLRSLQEKQRNAYGEISGISFSGQMHGLVMVDKQGEVIDQAIIWMDQRSEREIQEIEEKVSREEMGEIFHNRVFPGFAFPSLLWVKNHRPESFARIHKILLPKDYLRFRMTGEIGTDASDASSACLCHEKKRDWAWEIIKRMGFPEEIFPKVHEAVELAGGITRSCALETGLREEIPVAYGCGDQPAQSVGNGAVTPGSVICNIGTGGQISVYSPKDFYDPELRLHTFCHGIHQAYTIFGASLCSGMSLRWLKENILQEESFAALSELAASAKPGSGGILYLPYLSGERTPHMNAKATGMFFGLKLEHDRKEIVRAVMEGVTFSLRDSLELIQGLGIRGESVISSGGGASSPVWLQMQADIFGKEVRVSQVKEQACLGACILAGMSTGTFRDVKEACGRWVTFRPEVYEPNEKNRELYGEQYGKFKELYQRNWDLMN